MATPLACSRERGGVRHPHKDKKLMSAESQPEKSQPEDSCELHETTQLLRARSTALWAIRCFFVEQGFLEYDPPLLVRSPGLEPHLTPFLAVADACAAGRQYLHTSPEYALKRLLGADPSLDHVFALCACFRDEPPSRTHSPEFTMLEWYRRGADLEALMKDCEGLLHRCADRLLGRSSFHRILDLPGGERQLTVTLNAPFERLRVEEAFRRYARVELAACDTPRLLLDAGRAAGHPLTVRDEELALTDPIAIQGLWDVIFHQIFLSAIEPKLGLERPTFLTHYPASQAALARLDPADPRWALRFELFAGGLELANAFDELADPTALRQRFEGDLLERQRSGVRCPPIDEALLASLSAMGRCAGIALGVDRLLMLITGVRSIDAIRLQPWEGP